ncbi:hypothetical protein RND81_02G120500 [Saponaria officinalis]|uniref:C2 domain-containing protein n=1 Tax=Saponaria officinalis TaxID=3572 RepID=A0AAW1MSH4_SAPOF
MCSLISLEIKIRYVEGLTLGKKPIRKNVFVILSIENQIYSQNNRQVSTGICEEGEMSNPTWNEKLTMTMPIGTKYIILDICHKTKSIATTRVPTSDFIGNYTPQNYVHFLSYRLRNSYDEPNGIINFCVNVKGDKFGGQSEQNIKVNGISGYRSSYEESSYLPKVCNATSNIDGRRRCNDVVVGVPNGWFDTWH